MDIGCAYIHSGVTKSLLLGTIEIDDRGKCSLIDSSNAVNTKLKKGLHGT
jgi:hypothetical protein